MTIPSSQNPPESPLIRKLKTLENPFPYIEEARDALARVAALQKDLFVHDAREKAKLQAKRAIYGAAALILLATTVILTLFWVTFQIHESGLASGWVALLSFVVFGAAACAFGWLAFTTGSKMPTDMKAGEGDSI